MVANSTPKPKFPLGKLVATPAALEVIQKAGQSPAEFIDRHILGDWGECEPDDWQANDDALKDGERIFSVYKTKQDVKVWVITEGDRASTCILLPEEY